MKAGLFAAGLLAAGLPLTVAASAAPTKPALTVSPGIDHPVAKVTVTGSHLAKGSVEVAFDGQVVGHASVGGGGRLSVPVYVSRSAQPGVHTITAVESGKTVASTVFVVRTQWPQSRFQATGSGYNPWENTIGVRNAGSLQRAWALSNNPVEAGDFVIANGMIYAGGNLGVAAFNASTGALLWHFAISPDDSECSPSYWNQEVFTCDGNFLQALDANTGALLWRMRFAEILTTTITVIDGVAYVPGMSEQGQLGLVAVAVADQQVLWVGVGNGGFGDVAVDHGTVFMNGGYLSAFEASTGALKYSVPLGTHPQYGGAGVSIIGDGSIVAGGSDESIYKLDEATGAQQWATQIETSVGSAQAPTVGGGQVFTTGSSALEALDLSTGKLLWSEPVVVPSPVVLANGVVYVGGAGPNSGASYSFDSATGQPLAAYPNTQGGEVQWIIVVNGNLYETDAQGIDEYMLPAAPVSKTATR